MLGAAILTVAGLAAGCGGSGPQWSDIPATPTAELYEGEIEVPLTDRLEGRLAERSLRVLGQRTELMPAGVDWAQHLAYRDGHAAGLQRVRELVPDQDPPVLYAEYVGDRTLFVVARSTKDRTRLVVLTALAGEP